jgi:RHS repeat-associated protein
VYRQLYACFLFKKMIAYKKVPTARPDTKTWYDLLGRTRQTATEGWANKTINSVVTYDALGRAKTKTLPFYTGDAAILTTVAYNIYGGVQSETNNIGTTNYAYDYNPSNLLTISAATTLKTTVTNPMGQAKIGVTDGSGKVKNTTDNKGIVTEMKYDSWGNPISTTVAGVEVVTMTYDDYGRQTTLADKNAGTTTYLYNSFGELVKQVTPKGTHTMEYDVLGRIKTRNGTEGITSYTYVSSGNGVNQVKTVTGFSGETKAFTYDTFGRTLTETDVIDGISFINTYAYDQYSNLLTVKYPSDLLITREYDANGYLSTIKNGSTTIFENTSKNALGQYTAYTLGGNQAVEKTYNQYGVPTNFKANSGVIQNLSFDFELKTGNLTRRTDHRKGKFEHFTYDDINRLTSAQVGDVGSPPSGALQSYTFADNGNITSKTGIGAYKYDPNKIHAVVEVENTTAVIPTISQFITYSAFQQPTTITEGTNVLTYTYSSDYQRIKGVLSGNSGVVLNKRYYFGDFERDITSGVTRDIHYVGADGLNCIIEKVGTNVSYYYVYKDYLGSILTVTNSTGTIVQEQNFDAWGKNRNANDWTYTNIPNASLTWMTRGYTGHEHLVQFGLINMNGRLYDPILGRMLSPDNYTQGGSQGYNRYTYAMNNPLKYTDPDGQNPILIGAIIGGAVNVYTHWGQIKNGWDFAKAFGVGAVAGAATVWAGAGAIASMGLGTTGAISGFVGGGIGAIVGSPIQIAGNFVFFNDGFTGGDYLKGIAMGAIGGAVVGGIVAGIRGENFWWGNTVRTSPVTAIRDFLQKGKELYGKGSNSRMTIDEWIEWNTREGDNLVVHARQLTYEEATLIRGGSNEIDKKLLKQLTLDIDLPSRIAKSGMGNQEAGKFFGWGNGVPTKSVDDFTVFMLEQNGWTEDVLKSVSEGYRQIGNLNPTNPSALPRATQLEAILSKLFK